MSDMIATNSKDKIIMINKELDRLSNIIDRLDKESVNARYYCGSILAVFSGYLFTQNTESLRNSYLVIGILVVVVFAYLDYLLREPLRNALDRYEMLEDVARGKTPASRKNIQSVDCSIGSYEGQAISKAIKGEMFAGFANIGNDAREKHWLKKLDWPLIIFFIVSVGILCFVYMSSVIVRAGIVGFIITEFVITAFLIIAEIYIEWFKTNKRFWKPYFVMMCLVILVYLIMLRSAPFEKNSINAERGNVVIDASSITNNYHPK